MSRIPRYLDRYLGGTNLEVFKFGMYILFPIGWMYYFGTNLDNRFSVPDFWPKPGETHRIPFEREEMAQEIERLKNRRLMVRDRRLKEEEKERQRMGVMEGEGGGGAAGVAGE